MPSEGAMTAWTLATKWKGMYLDNDKYTGKHIPKKSTNDINTIIDELKRD